MFSLFVLVSLLGLECLFVLCLSKTYSQVITAFTPVFSKLLNQFRFTEYGFQSGIFKDYRQLAPKPPRSKTTRPKDNTH